MGNWGKRWILDSKRDLEQREQKFQSDLQRALRIKVMLARMSSKEKKIRQIQKNNNTLHIY